MAGSSGSSESFYDYATIKYSSAGVPLWTNRYNGPANSYDLATAMAVDRSGSVIVTGYSWDSGVATIKYSSAGVPLWTNLYNGPRDYIEDAMAVAVDGSNNVIVMGYAGGFGSSYDYATIKYSSAGVPLWTNRYNGPGNGNDYPRAVAVDASNNVIVTGSSGPAGSTNYTTIKYSSAGVPLWTNRSNGPGSTNDCACAVAVDGSNNVIVTGYSIGSRKGYADYATIKYSGAGVPLWTSGYNGPANGNDLATAIAVDGSGNVIVTGYSARTGSGYGYDFATIKYIFPLVIADCKAVDGACQLLLDNLQPGTLAIEASTNLTGWVPLLTNTTPTNTLFYTDPDAGSLPVRFYRAYQFP
ncbi:MAG: hypothetical protein LUO89_08485 [Methanothrix sp.]|nr:hypothetical protein [Methanothrix sp.]